MQHGSFSDYCTVRNTKLNTHGKLGDFCSEAYKIVTAAHSSKNDDKNDVYMVVSYYLSVHGSKLLSGTDS